MDRFEWCTTAQETFANQTSREKVYAGKKWKASYLVEPPNKTQASNLTLREHVPMIAVAVAQHRQRLALGRRQAIGLIGYAWLRCHGLYPPAKAVPPRSTSA
jgi:hypothetical protein